MILDEANPEEEPATIGPADSMASNGTNKPLTGFLISFRA
jgi:hypothetical protein